MKLNKIYISVLLLACFSCDSLLEVEPEGNIVNEDLKDAESLQRVLTGAYYNLGGIHDGSSGGQLLGGDFIVLPTLLAYLNGKQITWSSVDAPAYLAFANSEGVESINDRVATNWLRAYETISAVNNVLNNAQNIADSDERNRITGEARAIRGIIYFEMVRLYAPQYSDNTRDLAALPLLENSVVSIEDLGSLEFANVAQIYDAAEADLQSAANSLEAFGKNGTALSAHAAQAYLTQLYMHKGEYESAVEAATSVIASGEFMLTNTPLDAFNNIQNSTEDIFAIQQTLSNNAGDRSVGGGITAFYSSLAESGLGVLGVIGPALNSSFNPNRVEFQPADIRATVDGSVSSTTASSSVNGAFYQNQYNNDPQLLSSAKFLSAAHVIPVLRFGELLLDRAESIYKTNPSTIDATALSDLNAIRERAGLDALESTVFVSPEAFYDSIVIEKKRETLLEGTLLHDLRRRKSQNPDDDTIVLGDEFDVLDPLSAALILPVPQAEQDTE